MDEPEEVIIEPEEEIKEEKEEILVVAQDEQPEEEKTEEIKAEEPETKTIESKPQTSNVPLIVGVCAAVVALFAVIIYMKKRKND